MKQLWNAMVRVQRRLALVAVGAWALAACNIQGVSGMSLPSMGIKSYRAEDFFLGRKLEIAKALEAGDMTLARNLAKGTDLATPGDRDMTLMWFFMLPGSKTYPNYAAVRELVALGVDPDTQIAQGIGTALQSTMIPRKDSKDQSAIRFLEAMLDGGIDPNKSTQYGNTLLHRAAGPGGTLEHVKLLLKRGATINAKNSLGDTPLNEAIDTLKPEIAIYLVEHGAQVKTDAFNRLGVTPGWSASLRLNRIREDHPLHKQFEQLRDLMIAKGAKWPPDSPEVVREQMRAKGLTPIVPAGHKR